MSDKRGPTHESDRRNTTRVTDRRSPHESDKLMKGFKILGAVTVVFLIILYLL